MKKQDVTTEDFQEWLTDSELVFAKSEREQKRLIARIGGGLKVTVAGKIVWEGVQPFVAVEKYNSITEKYVDELKDFKL